MQTNHMTYLHGIALTLNNIHATEVRSNIPDERSNSADERRNNADGRSNSADGRSENARIKQQRQ